MPGPSSFASSSASVAFAASVDSERLDLLCFHSSASSAVAAVGATFTAASCSSAFELHLLASDHLYLALWDCLWRSASSAAGAAKGPGLRKFPGLVA